jgi:AcrR family transcriptional regulator
VSDTKERILVIAGELFARKGYTGTTIADIARELGTTTAALYYHFPSKADILGALLAGPLETYTRILRDLEADRLSARELLSAFIDLAVGSRDLASFIDRDPTVLARIDEQLPRKSHELMDDVISALAGKAPDRTAFIRAHAALALVKGATLAALAHDETALSPADRTEILDAAMRVIEPA